MDVREKSLGCVLYTPQTGTQPATYLCILTWNETHNFLDVRDDAPTDWDPPVGYDSSFLFNFFSIKDFIYLFSERGEGRTKGTETSMCGCLSHGPHWGPDLQPRHVPWLGIELTTVWSTGWPSIHWATLISAVLLFKFFCLPDILLLFSCQFLL